jgi:REP element-mobilizing transposase RayT
MFVSIALLFLILEYSDTISTIPQYGNRKKRGFRQKIRRRSDFEIIHAPGQEMILKQEFIDDQLAWDRQQSEPADPETVLIVQCMLALSRENPNIWAESDYGHAVRKETEAVLREYLQEKRSSPQTEEP